jgi:hypothetical protein
MTESSSGVISIGDIDIDGTTRTITTGVGQTVGFSTDIEVQGSVSISSGNLVLANGSGIDFSATPDGSGTVTSELLDDYEEGTWTPTIEGGTTAGSYTVSDVDAYYVKIGQRVSVSCRFKTTVNTAGSGYAKIGGLPYSYQANTRDVGPAVFRYWTSGTSNITTTVASPISSGVSNSILIICGKDNNADYIFLPITGLGSPSFNLMSIQYNYIAA